jgi:predicted HTH domain antitoxin
MQITIELPDDIVQSAHLTEAELLREIAIVLFQQERITLGRASLLCGMDQIEFQKLLASRGISIHYDIEDYEADLKSIREDGW